MLELRRIRALVTELAAELLAAAPWPDLAAIERAVAELAAARGVETRQIGRARDGTPIRAFGIAPPNADPAPVVLVVGVPRGDAPTGARTILALARRLCDDAALLGELGVRWWFVPCADPAGARENAGWWRAPLTLDTYARRIVTPPPADRLDAFATPTPPEQRALRQLIAEERPRTALFLYDTPIGGFALHQGPGAATAPWRRRAGDFARLLDPLGLPLGQDGPLGPADSPTDPRADPRDPYARFRADLDRPVGAALSRLGPPDLDIGAVVAPLFVDYARRERDRTTISATRRAVAAEGLRLWREWFAFGRTALDLIAPTLPAALLARSAAQQALVEALRGAETILAEGLRWPALIPDPDGPATLAESFAHGDAVRLARLPRLATLVRFLAEAHVARAADPPTVLTDALDRARETQTRWIDELAAATALRPLRRERTVAAQLGAILLALP